MPVFDPVEVAEWVGAEWTPAVPGPLAGVSKDTRTLQENALYVALKGERFDGHRFLADAAERGAAGALIQASEQAAAEADAPGLPLLPVPDTRTALASMARAYRLKVGPRVVGITGSAGKTTVKEMTAALLATQGETARTQGNWNNDIGVPLSLLAMEPSARYGVFEAAMNHPGEIRGLCTILAPEFGVVTNVGPVHIEFFGSEDEIAEEKADLLRALPSTGRAVLNRDGGHFEQLEAAAPCPVISVSLSREGDYCAVARDGTGMTIEERTSGNRLDLNLALPGEHQALNAMQAIAIARALGADWPAIKAALCSSLPLPMRWEQREVQGIRIINDAYNANPLSMRASLAAFLRTPVGRDRWLVLGGMLELGGRAEHEHRSLGSFIAERKKAWRGLVTIGELAGGIAEGACAAGMAPGAIYQCRDAAEAARVLSENLETGDAVLLKASRGERLEQVLESLPEKGGR